MPPDELARQLVEHPRWRWLPGMVLVWPKISTRLVVLHVTSRNTLFVTFIGQPNGLEIDPGEHDIYPDLAHPGIVGFLLSFWFRWSPTAGIQISREPDIGGTSTVEVSLNRWEVNMDFGSAEYDAEGTYLGVALAQILHQTWKRQARMTPMTFMKPDLSEVHRKVDGEDVEE